MNKIWQATVSVKIGVGGQAPGVPRVMTTEAQNHLEAKAYFQTFGKLLNDPRIIGEK